MNTVSDRSIGWAALMVFTGLVTAYWRSQIDPLMPPATLIATSPAG
jgi:hypothetical protein